MLDRIDNRLVDDLGQDVYDYIFALMDGVVDRTDASWVSGEEAGRIAHVASKAAERTYRDILEETGGTL